MPDEPQRPVTPKEQKTADRIVQGGFIVGLVACILIDAAYKDFELHPIIYTIFGAGSLGVDNFVMLLNKIRGQS